MPSALQENVDALKKTPETLSKLVSYLSDPQLRSRNSPDEFSALENICHLRDIELEAYTPRISRILSEVNPLLPDVDGGRLAVERDYNREDLSEALESFRLARETNIHNVQALGAADIDREGTLEGIGLISLRKVLQMIQEHDESHVRDLEVIRRRFSRTAADPGI